MQKELLEKIRQAENGLIEHINKRDNLRNKIRFCAQHKFEEEQRIANVELRSFETIIYDFEQFIKVLKTTIKAT